MKVMYPPLLSLNMSAVAEKTRESLNKETITMVIMMMMMMMMMIVMMTTMMMMIILCFLHPKGPQAGLAPGGVNKL